VTMQRDEKTALRSAHPDQMRAWRKTTFRMPVTLRPVLNQELGEWDNLFPFERAKIAGFFRAADSYSELELNAVTAHLRDLESKMGIANAPFDENSETLEYASEIARSAYYGEWRSEVQRVYNAIEARAPNLSPPQPAQRRLILMIFPKSIPMEREALAGYWRAHGTEFEVRGDSTQLVNTLMNGDGGSPSICAVLAHRTEGKFTGGDPSDLWFIDSDTSASSSLPQNRSSGYMRLSFAALNTFREEFLARLNSMQRDLAVADRVVATLRQTDWSKWCPAELNGDPRLRQFVIDLFLSGNGALVFPTAFAEWAASEAIRRVRPRVVVVRFGVRNKPKPFTSIAVFENQNNVSILPDEADPANSATDAAILADYVRRAAMRYPEYDQSLCLCIADSLSSAWFLVPGDARPDNGRTSVEELSRFVIAWLMNPA
jgi:hypothetical protein